MAMCTSAQLVVQVQARGDQDRAADAVGLEPRASRGVVGVASRGLSSTPVARLLVRQRSDFRDQSIELHGLLLRVRASSVTHAWSSRGGPRT
jgi:hypothetical protein